jgi:hypothetical protein
MEPEDISGILVVDRKISGLHHSQRFKIPGSSICLHTSFDLSDAHDARPAHGVRPTHGVLQTHDAHDNMDMRNIHSRSRCNTDCHNSHNRSNTQRNLLR